MDHARPPAELVLEGGPAARSEAWRRWRSQFLNFAKASGVSTEPKEVQASLLVNLIGAAGYEVFTTFSFTHGETEDDVHCVLKKFDTYFGVKINVTVRRFRFFSRGQEDGENVDQYVTALRVLSQHCEFGELNESLIRDRIVCGIIDSTVRDRLLRTEDLTLSKAMQICQAAEMSKEEGRCIGDRTLDVVQVNAVQGGSGSRGARRRARVARARAPEAAAPGGGRGGARPERARRRACGRCGSERCQGAERCPAQNATCYLCDKSGHFARVCAHKKTVREVLNLSVGTVSGVDEDYADEMFYVDTIEEDKKLCSSSNEWFEVVKCNGTV